MSTDILHTEVTTIDGEKTTLESYKGNVLLVVNVASTARSTMLSLFAYFRNN